MGRRTYRDYPVGKFTYRKWRDGRIFLMEGPAGSYYPEGKELKSGTSAYSKASSQISAYRQERATSAIQQATSVIESFLPQEETAPAADRGSGEGQGSGPPSSSRAQSPVAVPWAWIGVGTAVVTVVFIAAFAGGRR